jgi:hypothetical protein
MDMSLDSSKIYIEKLSGYKISKDDENHSKNLVSIKSNNSLVKIFNYINCGNLIYNANNDNPDNSNTLSIDNFTSNSFDLRLSEKDKFNMNLYEILDNSNLEFKNSDNLKIRVHPVLLCGINVFQEFNKKFMKILFFEDEGFIQSPNLVLNGDKLLKKGDITGWELVKLRDTRYLQRIIFISIFAFVFSLFLNEKNDLNRKYSDFKLYQLFLKKTLEDYLENKLNSK